MFNEYESLEIAKAVTHLTGVGVRAWKDKTTGDVTYEAVEPIPEFSEAEVIEAIAASKLAKEWEEVRVKRNSLLSRCDWTQGVDAPLTAEQVSAWATYRQALRDVTTQADPSAIVWPIEP